MKKKKTEHEMKLHKIYGNKILFMFQHGGKREEKSRKEHMENTLYY